MKCFTSSKSNSNLIQRSPTKGLINLPGSRNKMILSGIFFLNVLVMNYSLARPINDTSEKIVENAHLHSDILAADKKIKDLLRKREERKSSQTFSSSPNRWDCFSFDLDGEEGKEAAEIIDDANKWAGFEVLYVESSSFNVNTRCEYQGIKSYSESKILAHERDTRPTMRSVR